MAWTTPKTWTGSELLTASDLNQYVRDNLSTLYELVAAGGRKNLLDNGQMQVHQRNTSVASITTANWYTADRWGIYPSSLGTWTNSVENDAPTGSGFRKSLKVYCSTPDASPATSDYFQVRQVIEGQNLQAIKKGTADAEKLTLSFWTKSNKTGTYVVELYDTDNTRSVSATYTVVSSGTWEQQSITFPADATGAFDNDANGSLTATFWLAAGTDFTSGTLQTTWAAATTAANRAVGQANLASASANYWQITGVQLEIGDTATGYEHLPYGDELATCQRYYYRHATGAGCAICPGVLYNTGTVYGHLPLPVTMRATPTSACTSGTAYFVFDRLGVADYFNTITVEGGSGPNLVRFYNNSEISGGTNGDAGLLASSDAAAVVAFTADL